MMQIIETLNEERAKLIKDSIEEGRIKGKIEGKIEYVRNMLNEKIPIELICKVTKMTENEIRKLIK